MNEVEIHQVDQSKSIELTESAKKHLLMGLEKQKNAIGVKFSVKKTGCSGLSYEINFVDFITQDDLTFPLSAQYKIYVDKKSYPFLQGMRVDYVKDAFGSKLVFQNPNQKGQCGCGESFTV
jgi:iron-sulfur cluster assembly protein